jgi:hypothetical protein
MEKKGLKIFILLCANAYPGAFSPYFRWVKLRLSWMHTLQDVEFVERIVCARQKGT